MLINNFNYRVLKLFNKYNDFKSIFNLTLILEVAIISNVV